MHKSNHNMKVFVLKSYYLLKKYFFKSPRKEVTSIKKTINSLDLTLSRNFDQQDSISFEMISLIVLIAESNFLSRYAL